MLGARVLAWSHVEKWIVAEASRATVPAGVGDTPSMESSTSESVTLGYLVEGSPWPRHVVVPTGGSLEALHTVATRLEARYGWLLSEASVFVLTDVPPGLPGARVRLTHRFPWAAATTISLQISPRTKPNEVAALYRRVRAQALGPGRRVRALGQRSADLAVHAFDLRRHATWRQTMEAWNEAQPKGERRYRDPRSFRRDCVEAFRALTGEEQITWEEAAPGSPRTANLHSP